MQITQSFNEIAAENTYYVYNEAHLLIIDPGSNTDEIFRKIEETKAKPIAILLTHTHYDHILSVEAIRCAFPEVAVYVSEKEESWLYTPAFNLSGLTRHDDMADVIVQAADVLFEDFQTYNLGGLSFQVLPTPGHSIGGVSFLFQDFVLTGDALFRESVGRTDLPTGDYELLKEGIRKQLFTLSNDLPVYPGHGSPTTIGHEKTFNPHFQ